MATAEVSKDGSPEALSSEQVVEDKILRNRSRLDAATQFVEQAGDGTSRFVRLVGAVGRFPLNVVGTAAGEVARAARETVESYRNSANAGKSPSGAKQDSLAA
ncbi:hypothetical protein A2424_03365 [Candidatus Peribacteria bacterium RIFOXYC1_FULL_54_13]|nr:MAG: hypothetical protein UY87_C0012G0020 [Candidatus Peribacteria bacterium GW2011_GWC2_54_8]OGJ70966.1 MAG: hypothetical protein A2198_00990 [Candidatus Peribacteria bacterium RIFOXYA1_FULL_56_14]OGJ74261.1 MAG: hypothetical protein A2384_06025 [Candidatus Peribacteria bacterium RIFOXYB1_FULL_54_35]OGJ75205.1 MAG: hypothetical protein A2217_05775 [Candidatus Peribacteria bacterium RIFOXYA2_FULL_55_28]OGJ75878.1 MAG: hypothetical protein A2327_03170 [Candidatus Peribacteria bacterium RIFOXY